MNTENTPDLRTFRVLIAPNIHIDVQADHWASAEGQLTFTKGVTTHVATFKEWICLREITDEVKAAAAKAK
jgi:hypothetical protein